jgi:hypothetical protein
MVEVEGATAGALELQQRLSELGLTTENHRVLMLLPLVYVAWADGKMEELEIEQILEFARQRLYFPPSVSLVLQDWLATAPTKEYVEKGLSSLLDIALDEAQLSVDVSELQDLVLHAESIARATSLALDQPLSITPEEHQAISEIADMLQVDSGRTWNQVLEEVKSQRLPKFA